MRKFKKRKILMIGLGVGLTLIIAAIVVIVFGIDQRIIKTPLRGTVMSASGEVVEAAEVSIQGQVISTDNSGKFAFADINFGNYELTVTKNGFSPYRNTVKINRFANNIDVVLRSEEFGEVLLKFDSDNVSSIAEDMLEVKINNMIFPLTKIETGFELKTGRLLTGTYLVEINSPNYVDSQTRIEIKPGTEEKTIWLIPAADLVTELEDYISLQRVVPGSVSVSIAGSKRQATKDELIENRLELKDLDITKPVELEIEHSGYLKKIITVELKQGLNSLDKTMLVPEGRHLLVEGRFVKSVQIDGSLPKTIFEGSSNCEMLAEKGNIYLAKCGSTVVAVTTENGDYRLLREYYWNLVSGDFLVGENKLITISEDLRDLVLIHSTSNNSVIYSHDKDISTVVGDNAGNIYFSDGEAVFKLDRSSSVAKEIIKGRYFLQSVSPNRSLILALSHDNSTENNMWVIDLNSNQSRKLSFLPGNFSKLRFIKNDFIAYLDNRNLYVKQLDSQQQQELLTDVGNFWVDPTGEIYFAHKRQTRETVFATQQNKLEKSLKVIE